MIASFAIASVHVSTVSKTLVRWSVVSLDPPHARTLDNFSGLFKLESTVSKLELN